MALLRYDKNTFSERLERSKYIDKIFPKGLILMCDRETFYIFDEAKMAFINGELISTILLCQAFIERRLQIYFESIGLKKVSDKGLNAMISYAKNNKNMLPNFLVNKIDLLRKKRNPFMHLKEFDHEYTFAQRLLSSTRKEEYKQPLDIIVEDAKEAITLMYTISITDFP